jgi:hypothetical protein
MESTGLRKDNRKRGNAEILIAQSDPTSQLGPTLSGGWSSPTVLQTGFLATGGNLTSGRA